MALKLRTAGSNWTGILNYSIDIDFIGNLLTMEPEIKDELSALKNINKSITALSDKFI